MVFAHGLGCNQHMWRHVAPAFERDHPMVLFDHYGHGDADSESYDADAHSTLDGWADDLDKVIVELGLRDVVLVGHSVSAMLGVLAVNRHPDLYASLVLISPSPRYIDDGDYVGGFTSEQIAGLLSSIDDSWERWAREMAPVIMGSSDHPELAAELTNSFCLTDPRIVKQLARATFLGDNRADLAAVTVPTLVLQSAVDAIAPVAVGEYVHRQISGSRFAILDSVGHCPNMTAPSQTASAIEAFLG